MKAYLGRLFRSQSLSAQEAEEAMNLIMRGDATAEEMAGFLGALAGRGETAEEIRGCAASLRKHAITLPVQRRDLIDVCGTGGDGAETFNISTTNALVLAAAELGVVKHGNRAVSSKSGSADVLEALGLKIDMTPAEAAAAVDAQGFAFLFSPLFHPAMKNVMPVRRALGVRTIFNLIGPLANPSPVKRQVIGVFAERWLEPVAQALLSLEAEEALVVWGSDGLDELSIGSPTHAIHVKHGGLVKLVLEPESFGLDRAELDRVRGGDKQDNARITEAILKGEKGPKRDIVLMNAGAALVVAGRAKTWKEGAQLAAQLIDQGTALQKLEQLRAKS
jgi:anthranilate phosphoribosyltransferase